MKLPLVMARSLVDTNILIYSRDARAAEKRLQSIEVIEDLATRGEFVLSAQCLNEFAAVSRRHGIAIPEIQRAVLHWLSLGEILDLQGAATPIALDGVMRHGLSFWDALIWATAREGGVPVIVSEDFQDGQEVEGVRFVNPFHHG